MGAVRVRPLVDLLACNPRQVTRPSGLPGARPAWLLGAVVAAVLVVYLAFEAARTLASPDDGTDAAGMYLVSVFAVGSTVVCVLALCLWQAFRPARPGQVHVLPPPGWYQDPHLRDQLRYWDGWQWTEHVR